MIPSVVIVSSKDVPADGCWLPACHLGQCHECSRVAGCKQDEAVHGRCVVARRGLRHYREALAAAEGRATSACEALRELEEQG